MQSGPWHIFHFIGHGGFNRDTDEGVMILADETEPDQLYRLSATQLGRLLAGHHTLRFVLLNSCEGATSNKLDIFSSTAATLVRRDIPAVLAMQYEITDWAAIEFSRAFYEALADSIPVDAAVVYARQAVSLALPNTVEWGTPVLYLRAPDGRIFDIERMSPEERRKAKIALLYRKAQTALDGEEWQTASELLQEVLALEPSHVEARTTLRRLPEEQELAKLYLKGQEHYEAGQGPEALSCLRRVHETRPHYKRVDELIVAAERSQEQQNRRNQIAALLQRFSNAYSGKMILYCGYETIPFRTSTTNRGRSGSTAQHD